MTSYKKLKCDASLVHESRKLVMHYDLVQYKKLKWNRTNEKTRYVDASPSTREEMMHERSWLRSDA